MRFENKKFNVLSLLLIAILLPGMTAAGNMAKQTEESQSCSQIAEENNARMLMADVVAIDHPMIFNRLGAQNVNWMMYALQHDVVYIKKKGSEENSKTRDDIKLIPFSYEKGSKGNKLFEQVKKSRLEAWRERKKGSDSASQDMALRPDLRPRPLVLRVAAGDYLKVRFTNLLHHKLHRYGDAPSNYANPFEYPDPFDRVDSNTSINPVTGLPLGLEEKRLHPMEHAPHNTQKDQKTGKPLEISQLQTIYTADDQVASRVVGFHPQGLELVRGIKDDSSYVGKNPNSLARPGETIDYCFYAPVEGAFLVSNDGAVFGGEGTAGNSGVGLFGAVTVQPEGARFYRAQVTEEELRLATIEYLQLKDEGEIGTVKKTDDGHIVNLHPRIDYETKYPDDCASNGIWCQEGKAGKPILNMLHGNRIIHGDINALIVGPNDDGSFNCSAYPLESKNEEACEKHLISKKYPNEDSELTRNPTLPNRLEPFREFVSIFHDENAATQAFPYFFEHPELKHTLHGVRDSFMINYGSGGIGAEIIANRLNAGPMQDCLDCAYEEFFLSAFAVGDAAMLVDKPANLITSQCQPEFVAKVKIPNPLNPAEEIEVLDPRYHAEREKFCVQPSSQKATEAYYPHDPSNVHHSYIGDFVKFRNMHSGKEQHIFHLHNHQWLFNPNDDNSNYIDAQGIGPGSGYTYEIAFGGSGNRNKTVGDAIFHCHFYPHFAQGMWYMWRNHDVFEAGTPLAVSQTKSGFHDQPFALQHGKPAANSRALPDGEIVDGTPIPAIVPLPGKWMAPMPEPVYVTQKENGLGSKAELVNPFSDQTKNPGFPFWIAGVTEHGDGDITYSSSVGSRPTTPPLDMSFLKDESGKIIVAGHNGGLSRHAMSGFSAGGKVKSNISRFTAEKHLEKAKAVFYDESGTDLEKVAMAFHAQRKHASIKVDMNKVEHSGFFITNGAKPVPGAPFNDPCIDDRGKFLRTGENAEFFGGTYGSFIDVDHKLLPFGIEYGGDNPRVYKGANLQLDVVFNKIGYHYPQQRILTLWEDVGPLIDKTRPPEPLVMRMNTFDCAMYAHTNLIPHYFYADDYQITTPTDVIGQHIHLPKWDLTSADGGANGWNYEDGTFSPGIVRERIAAINAWNDDESLIPVAHPYFRGDFEDEYTICSGKENCDYQLTSLQCKTLWNETILKAQENKERNVIEANLFLESLDGKSNKCEWLGNHYQLSDEECNRHIEEVIEEILTKDTEVSRLFEKGFFRPGLPELAENFVQPGKPGVCEWLGARTTLQRWFSDPIVNKGGKHRGLGTTFTHDHLGPSTHQQIGLYATMLSEPPGSQWRHNETGDLLYDKTTRKDGGPTSWQAVISGKGGEPINYDGTPGDDSHREFFLQFGDFQHAYVKDAYYGVTREGIGWMNENQDNPPKKSAKPTPDSFRLAINPSVRKPAQPVFPDIIAFEPTCPGGKEFVGKAVEDGGPLPGSVYGKNDFNNTELYSAKGQPLRPCAEAISADDVGMMVVNYRNEPVGARVYDPDGIGPDGKKGVQASGLAGDLAFAMQTRIDRKLEALNDIKGDTPYKPLTFRNFNGDPFTPILRVYSGDSVKVKIQGGSHEHEHNGSINALAWLQSGSGYGQAPHSGWRNAQNTGLSEQFTFTASITDLGGITGMHDRMYTVDSSQDGIWNGVWGIIRSKSNRHKSDKLTPLPNNLKPTLLTEVNTCPEDAPIASTYRVSAVLANKVLENSPNIKIPDADAGKLEKRGGTLVYNPRDTAIKILVKDGKTKKTFTHDFQVSGPLHDPTAIMFVRSEDLENGKIKPGKPVEPLVLRAAAGKCIKVELTNALPKESEKMPDLYGYTSLSGIIIRDKGAPESKMTTFNNNLIRPSNHIGLHPQLVHYNIHQSDANNIGVNEVSTVAPGESKTYYWYAGKLEKKDPANMLKCLDKHDWFNDSKLKFLDQLALINMLAQVRISDFDTLIKKLQKPDKLIKEILDPESGKVKELLEGVLDQSQVTNLIKNIKTPFNIIDLKSLDDSHGDDYYNKLQEIYENWLLSEKQSPGEMKSQDKMIFFKQLHNIKNVNLVKLLKKCGEYDHVGVEFGGTNLTPPDRIKQGQKGAIGALVIEPQYATWSETDQIIDRQAPGEYQSNMRDTRTMATVSYPTLNEQKIQEMHVFRDLVMIHQKGLNLRYADGTAVPNIASEREKAEYDNPNHPDHPLNVAPEDAHDSGHMAINYGAEPMWFRFGMPPDVPFGKKGLGGIDSAWQVFSNECCSNGNGIGTVISADERVNEPYVPVMRAYAGQEMRIRALMPTGVGRASTMTLHGHVWQRDPYLAGYTQDSYPRGDTRGNRAIKGWGTPSKCIGANALAMHLGGQESISPMAHFDLAFPSAGGKHKVTGDYLWRDQAGFGITNGLWALVRVTDAPPKFNDGKPGKLRSSCDIH